MRHLSPAAQLILRAPAAAARPARPALSQRVRAMATEGQIDSELITRMRGKISAALETDQVEVTDLQGDGRHVEIVVVAEAFEGKSAVNRQRMVYKAIWEELQDAVHAVDAMQTKTPSEAAR
jgi:stress-induced morphogen